MVVFIPKPGRTVMSKLRITDLSALPSVSLKTLERLVDRLLKTRSLTCCLLTSAQYAYKEGRQRPTETALHYLTGKIEAQQLETKRYVIGTFLDIEGAFDSTSNKAIKEALIKHEIAEPLVDWVEVMLAGRNLLAECNNVEGQTARLPIGLSSTPPVMVSSS